MEKLEYVDPAKLYEVIREEKEYTFILETKEKIGRHRFTFIGFDPDFIVKVKNGYLFRELENLENEIVTETERKSNRVLKNETSHKDVERFSGGFVGCASYDAALPYIGIKTRTPSIFGYYTKYFVIDHTTNRIYCNHDEGEKLVRKTGNVKFENAKVESDIISCDAEIYDFIEMVEKAKEYVYAGDVFQVVISRKYEIKTNLDPFQTYLRLRNISPSPYMFLLEFDNISLCGASPETLASIFNGKMIVNPIAGTIRRGKDEKEDGRLAIKLLNDEKERAEHAMLVDLARNDVRKVCEARSVKVERFMEVVKYSHVMHIESTVVGKLKTSPFRGIEAAFPAGTLTGAPKVRAMEIISEIEKSNRGFYGGGIGYFSGKNADMAIAIRMVEFRNGKAIVRGGAGIVADSKPIKEFHETERKMLPALKALGVRE